MDKKANQQQTKQTQDQSKAMTAGNKKMNTVTDFKKFSDWIKEKNVSQSKNPEEQNEIDLKQSLIDKASKGIRKSSRVSANQSQSKQASVTDQTSQTPDKKRSSTKSPTKTKPTAKKPTKGAITSRAKDDSIDEDSQRETSATGGKKK